MAHKTKQDAFEQALKGRCGSIPPGCPYEYLSWLSHYVQGWQEEIQKELFSARFDTENNVKED